MARSDKRHKTVADKKQIWRSQKSNMNWTSSERPKVMWRSTIKDPLGGDEMDMMVPLVPHHNSMERPRCHHMCNNVDQLFNPELNGAK